jgi:hypothetical protein
VYKIKGAFVRVQTLGHPEVKDGVYLGVQPDGDHVIVLENGENFGRLAYVYHHTHTHTHTHAQLPRFSTKRLSDMIDSYIYGREDEKQLRGVGFGFQASDASAGADVITISEYNGEKRGYGNTSGWRNATFSDMLSLPASLDLYPVKRVRIQVDNGGWIIAIQFEYDYFGPVNNLVTHSLAHPSPRPTSCHQAIIVSQLKCLVGLGA